MVRTTLHSHPGVFLGRTSPAQGFAVWQKLVHPSASATAPLCGISMVALLFPVMVSDPGKLSSLCSFKGDYLPTLPSVQESGWECPWQKTPGQRRHLACWSCAMSPYGPGMVSAMTNYEGYSCLTMPNSAKGTLRAGC